jgi:hypothetical protein
MTRLATTRPARRPLLTVAAITTSLVLGACDLGLTDAPDTAAETILADAFTAVPVGFSATENTFASAENEDWRPMRRRHPGRGGPFGGAFGTGPMGGGLGADFQDGVAFRAGHARGPFGGNVSPGSCPFDASAGKAVCAPVTDRRGLTVERWVIWKDIDGTVQASPDSTTFSRQTHAEVSGTVPAREGATRTVRHVSDRLITGLQQGSAQRTVEGTSAGTETVSGTVAEGAFTAERVVADTTRGVVIPVRADGRSYPIAGTVIRRMRATVTIAGSTSESAEWREQLTYDGSATATLVITRNGESKTCSVPLPMGRPVCE